MCEQTLFFPRDAFWWQEEPQFRPARWARSMMRRFKMAEPLLLRSYFSSTAKSLATAAATSAFDLVWVERLLCLRWMPDGLKSRVIVDLDDLEHRKLRREIAVTKTDRQTPFDYLEYLKLRRFELNVTKLPFEFIVSSDFDKQLLGNKENVTVVPNGVVLPGAVPLPGNDDAPPIILFVGLMDYQPNVDAVRFFAREVLPLIHGKFPEARFVIVGRSPSPTVRDLNDGTKIIVTGTVPEVEPYLRQAAVVVAPLRVGGGTRIKILEAMAHRRPVVATTIGAEGLEAEAGKHLLIADTAPNLADACVRLLRDREMGREMSTRAFDLVRAKYDWSQIRRLVGRIILRDPLFENLATPSLTAGRSALLNNAEPAGPSALS
jgi:glycosyltransferase involved in cell wall biosynthesis